MSEPFMGQIQPFGFNFAPVNWAMCNGQLMAISQNSALFSLLGTSYGGNGTTTFALPNLQSRMMIHQGTGPGLPTYVIGEAAGSPQQTLTIANLPTHSHALNASTAAAASASPQNGFLSAATGSDNDTGAAVTVNVYGPTANTTMNGNAIGVAGSSSPVPTMPPFLTVNICIALFGVFPSRS